MRAREIQMMLERAVNTTENHRDQYTIKDRESVESAISALENAEIDVKALLQLRIGQLVNNIRRKLNKTDSELKKRMRCLVQKWQKVMMGQDENSGANGGNDQNQAPPSAAQEARKREEELRLRLMKSNSPVIPNGRANGNGAILENGDAANLLQKKKVSAKRKAKKRTDEIKHESLLNSPRGSPTNGSRSPMVSSPLLDSVDRDSTGGGRLSPADSAPSSPVRKRPKSRSNTPNLSNLSNKIETESNLHSTLQKTPPEITSSHHPPSPAARVPSTANPSSTRLKQNTTNESTTPQFSDQPRFVPSVSADSEPQTLQPPKTPQQEDVEKAAKDDVEWEGVSGVRDIKGNFHRWHDEISLEPEGTEPFLHILPYVDLDFDLL